MKIRLFFIAWLVTTQVIMVQGRTFQEGFDEFRPYGYQRMWRWEQLRAVYCDGREFRDSLFQALNARKSSYLICPWWLEDLYCDPSVAAVCRGGMGYVGYVLDPLTGTPELTNEWNNNTRDCILNDSIYLNVPYDLVVYCRTGEAFDRFLLSEKARLNFLHQVFEWPDGLVNKKHLGRKPRGINFFLPDLSFQEKRAFTQFMKSVSMIIDSLCVGGGTYPYAGSNCMLYITLPTEGVQKMNFLSGITKFVDHIYFADYDEYGVAVATAGTLDRTNDPTQLVVKLFNEFYLFDLDNKSRPQEACCSDIVALAQADYDIFQWKKYFYLDIILGGALLVLVILYNLHSPFYILVDRNRWLIAPVIITLVTEMFIVFLYMLEAISKDVLLFDMNGTGHYWLLALPLVFILVNVLLRLMNQRKIIP